MISMARANIGDDQPSRGPMLKAGSSVLYCCGSRVPIAWKMPDQLLMLLTVSGLELIPVSEHLCR